MTSHPHARIHLLQCIVILVLFVLGFWQFGKGAFITVKAQVAQVLLEQAWQKTLDGHTNAKPWPWADTSPVARLRVPKLGIDQIVLSGASGRNLAFGPAFVQASQEPGKGTSIVAGHRDTHFTFLQNLQENDAIFIQTPDGLERTYRVRHMEVADTRKSQLSLNKGSKLVLVTCYPFNVIAPTGPLRYVVTATLNREYVSATVAQKVSF
jgi:sortase A